MTDHHSTTGPATDKKLAGSSVEERSIAPSEAASTAPLLKEPHHGAVDEAKAADGAPRRKSFIQRFKEERAERKAVHDNVYNSGPYVMVFDPKLGKEILRKNPHWPYEDSYKRENVGLTVEKGQEDQPDFVKQQTGKWGQTSDSSAQDYYNGNPAGYL
ncbi:hypothetical protein LTR10_006718 [Elasticomyces elasticus]|nr:hypothetical protein LTR10_006718 [Elasticomyces elasticus]KAK4972881.1 hypothetical protein LTR42_006175 [Elasticomyces elasticus]